MFIRIIKFHSVNFLGFHFKMKLIILHILYVYINVILHIGIAVVKKRLRAPRMVKLSKPRPLRRIATSKETDSITTCIEVNNNLAQSTKYTSDFFHIGSLEEAEGIYIESCSIFL